MAIAGVERIQPGHDVGDDHLGSARTLVLDGEQLHHKAAVEAFNRFAQRRRGDVTEAHRHSALLGVGGAGQQRLVLSDERHTL